MAIMVNEEPPTHDRLSARAENWEWGKHKGRTRAVCQPPAPQAFLGSDMWEGLSEPGSACGRKREGTSLEEDQG